MILNEKFWLAVAFLTFAIIIIKIIGKNIVTSLNEKSQSIKKALDDAKKAKEMAEKLLAMDKRGRDELRWRVVSTQYGGGFATALAEWQRQND